MNVRQVIPKNAIPSVDEPRFDEVYDGDSTDQVVVVELEGRMRAYPLRYLDFHEIVNDEVAGRPIAVTWCPLCGSAVVYDRRLARATPPEVEDPTTADGDTVAPLEDGSRLTFGVSGKLADDDLVMYDRETDSEWKQSQGRAIAGPLSGWELSVVPAAVTTYEAYREDFPDGVVLAPPGGESEAAGPGDDPEPIDYDRSPYGEYFESDGFGLAAHRDAGGREWDREDLDPKTVVLGLELHGEALGFPLPAVEEADGVVTATVGDVDVVVFADESGVHAYRDPGFDWSPTRTGFRGGGAVYDPTTGEPRDMPAAHTGANREPLERLPARRLFAFTWQDDHGPDAFYDG